MEGRELADLKNNILKELTNHNEEINAIIIYDSLNRPLETYQHFQDLIQEMGRYHKKYIKSKVYYSGGRKVKKLMVASTIYTRKFLDEGGFVKEYDDETVAYRKMNESTLKSSRIKELQLENLKLSNENLGLSNKLSTQKLKTHWIPLVFSGISTLIALGTLVWSIKTRSSSLTEEQMNPKIESIQNRLENLENGLKKERDSLKEELYKAEMMVRVLEEQVN
ncbi:hypothetical protein [Maribacter luteus]|uniref:hypothetical protein n=1 Tax=Maribacter luteus TaxID=2594478 RepID=UPI0024903114|nr:hypothetical protein [Maribacter luteus]